MKVSNLKTISEYNTLLENLNPRGKYQMRIFGICLLYWMIAGMYTTVFETGYDSFKCKEAMLSFQILGMIVFAWFSVMKGRKVSMMLVQIFSFVGIIFVLIAVIDVFKDFPNIIGICAIGLSVFTQPFLILCIVCQLTTIRTIQIVFSLSICSFCIGRIWVVPVVNKILGQFEDPEAQITLLLLAPIVIFSLIPNLYTYQSPRYFIQKNINKAEELIRNIVRINTGKQGEIQIDQNFVLKRIHLRKYNYFTLYKFQSFGFSQYCTGVVLFLLGIICEQSEYVFAEKNSKDEEIQILWICGFEMIGAIASIFFLKFCLRRMTSIFLAALIAIVSTILYATPEDNIYEYLVLLALNAVFSTTLFIFLVMNCIQFYPHSIRTLGLAMMFGCFYFGQLFFYAYTRLGVQQKYILEMFMMASWIMFFHCFGQEETLKKGLNYEIREIQQEQNQQV